MLSTVHGQSLIKHFFVDDIQTDKNVTIPANENGTEWKPTPKNETEDNQEGSGNTTDCCVVMDQWICPCSASGGCCVIMGVNHCPCIEGFSNISFFMNELNL